MPNCNAYTISQSDIINNFEIYHGGTITAQNITISSPKSGVILSGEKVRLLSGFKVNSGAKVYIAVKGMHCNERGDSSDSDSEENARRAPQKQEIKTDTPQATKILRNGQLFILRDSKTYTVMGAEVR